MICTVPYILQLEPYTSLVHRTAVGQSYVQQLSQCISKHLSSFPTTDNMLSCVDGYKKLLRVTPLVFIGPCSNQCMTISVQVLLDAGPTGTDERSLHSIKS